MDDWKAQKFKFDSQFLLQNPRLVYMPAKVSKHKRTQKLSSDRWLVSLVNFPGNFWVLFSITNVNDETIKSNAEVSLNAKWNRAIGDLKGFLSWYYKGAFFTVRHTTWKCLLRDVRISPSLRNVLLAAKQSNEASTIVSAKTHAI